MTAINSAETHCTQDESLVHAATDALRTGLFAPIPNLDPDISNRVRISPAAPTIWDRFFGKKR
ncbi:hypothetical protein [Glutamicibacter endophyticus]|uniref:hypothetical protein n=1 Tax=Glutamicibacter endophyticus TaxID=1522174 RepID=UPI003AF122A1